MPPAQAPAANLKITEFKLNYNSILMMISEDDDNHYLS